MFLHTPTQGVATPYNFHNMEPFMAWIFYVISMNRSHLPHDDIDQSCLYKEFSLN